MDTNVIREEFLGGPGQIQIQSLLHDLLFKITFD